MKTKQIKVTEVKVGMKFLDVVKNRLDPLFGREVVKTVTQVTPNPHGNVPYTLVYGVRDEPDYLGNKAGGGAVLRNNMTITVLED